MEVGDRQVVPIESPPPRGRITEMGDTQGRQFKTAQCSETRTRRAPLDDRTQVEPQIALPWLTEGARSLPARTQGHAEDSVRAGHGASIVSGSLMLVLWGHTVFRRSNTNLTSTQQLPDRGVHHLESQSRQARAAQPVRDVFTEGGCSGGRTVRQCGAVAAGGDDRFQRRGSAGSAGTPCAPASTPRLQRLGVFVLPALVDASDGRDIDVGSRR